MWWDFRKFYYFIDIERLNMFNVMRGGGNNATPLKRVFFAQKEEEPKPKNLERQQPHEISNFVISVR